MRFVMFVHSLVSDWNHGDAHFLRGVCSELLARGHEVAVWEPKGSWSVANLVAEQGLEPVRRFRAAYPHLTSREYDPRTFDPGAALEGADCVLVHEWNDPALVARIGHWRSASGPTSALLFHDTPHRDVSASHGMARCDLSAYDGVLAVGAAVARNWRDQGVPAWIWHHAADIRVFRPLPPAGEPRGVVWIGDWGDGERGAGLEEFLIGPVRRLRLRAAVYGERWPESAPAELRDLGIDVLGWLPNFAVPQAYAAARITVHVPRRSRAQAQPGIPAMRVFEALACGIPLVSAPWEDAEGLFVPGEDFLVARDGTEMEHQMRDLIGDPAWAKTVAARGLARIRAHHTCAHRVDELMAILAGLGISDEEVAIDERPAEDVA